MKRLLLAAPVLLAQTALVDAAVGQAAPPVPPNQARGPFTSFPFGLTTTEAHRTIENGHPGGDKVMLRGPNANGTEPWTAGFVGPGTPDYSSLTLFAWSQDAQQRIPELDAISTGNSMIPNVLSDGSLSMNNLWFGMVMSLEHNPMGYGPTLCDSGAHLLSFFFNGSQHIHPDYPGTVRLENRPSGLGWDNHSAPDIDGMDYGMGLIHVNPRDRVDFVPGDFILNRRDFHFSVGKAWADANHDFVMTANGDLVDPAVVYKMTWNGTAWTTPIVQYDRAALGLDPIPAGEDAAGPNSSTDEDVDALMFGPGFGGILIFSTQLRLGRNQIRVIKGSNPPLDLKDSGTLVSDRYALGTDDNIDSLCGDDPEGGLDLAYVGGTPPFVSNPPAETRMSLSVARQVQVDTNGDPYAFYWHFALGGWGDAPQKESKVVFHIEMEYYYPVGGGNPWLTVPVTKQVTRGANDDVCTSMIGLTTATFMGDDYSILSVPGVIGHTNQWGEMRVFAEMHNIKDGSVIARSHEVKLEL